MTSFSLTRFDKDGIELLIDTNTGESFASISGYARMVGKAISTIHERLSKAAFGFNEVKQAQIHTESGSKTVRLITEDLMVEWIPKDNPKLATQLLKLGIRKFLHQIAGYQFDSIDATIDKIKAIDLSFAAANKIVEIKEKLFYQPRLAQTLTDHTMNLVVEQHNALLNPSKPKLRGLVEIACDMGYKSQINASSRVSLGQKLAPKLRKYMQKEERYCNNIPRDINCYPDIPEVRQAITNYFESRGK